VGTSGRSGNGDRHFEDSEKAPGFISGVRGLGGENGDRHLEDSEPVPIFTAEAGIGGRALSSRRETVYSGAARNVERRGGKGFGIEGDSCDGSG